jgi:hypothetical protein
MILHTLRFLSLALVLLCGSAAPAQALTEEQLLDVYSHAYDASGKLSKADFKLIVRFELLVADWNSELAPMVKGLRDPGMVPAEWARSARRSLDQVAQVRLKMTIAVSLVEDQSTRSLVRQISDINGQMLTAWEDLRQAVMDGDDAAYRLAGMRAQALAQEKVTVAGPILRRLREKVGDKAVDGALERELRELSRKLGL